MPLGSKLILPWGHNFTLIYIRKTSNDIFSLKGVCLIFLSAIYQLFIKYFNIK